MTPSTSALLCSLLLQSLSPEAIEHAQAGTEAQKQGRLDVAIKEFRQLTELQPDLASAYANLGDAYFLHGDYALAIPALERALQLKENLMASHETLGVALLLQGDAAGALPHLEKTRNPALLGLAYLETGQLANAIAGLKTALLQQPDDPDLLYYFGHATELTSKRAFAQMGGSPQPSPVKESDIPALIMALAQKSTDPDLLNSLGVAASLAANHAFDHLVTTAPNSARAHQVAAERLLQTGHVDEAIKEYGNSIHLQPATAGVHLALGNIFASQRKWAQAIAEYVAETRLRPSDADAARHLNWALAQSESEKRNTK